MEKGLGEAVKFVFPNAEHRVCMRHLWKNIKKMYHCHESSKLQNVVWSIANTLSSIEYNAKVNELYTISPQIHSYLLSLSYKWSKSQFSYDIKNIYNTNNMAKSFNAWIGDAREKPVVELIDMIRGMLMEQRVERKLNSAKWRGDLVPATEEYIREITTRKDYFIIRKSSAFKTEVEGHLERQVVDIEHRECTCKYWQVTGLPCIHATAFIGSNEPQSWHIYVDNVYHVIRYSMAYEGAIFTLPGKDQWKVVDDGVQVGSPNTIRPKGRPKKRRFKSFLETGNKKSKRFHKCGRCGKWGHHRSSCKNPLSQTSQAIPGVNCSASEAVDMF